MIYELRTYTCMPGKRPAVLKRMQTASIPIFGRLGIRSGPVLTVAVGANSLEVRYMIEWDSLAERERLWSAFLGEPDWQKAVAESESNGPILEKISNEFLSPVQFA